MFQLQLPYVNKATSTLTKWGAQLMGEGETVQKISDHYEMIARVGFIVTALLAIAVLLSVGYGIYRLATGAQPASMSPITFGVLMGGTAWLGWEGISCLFRLSKIYNTKVNYPELAENGLTSKGFKFAATYSPLLYLGAMCADKL